MRSFSLAFSLAIVAPLTTEGGFEPIEPPSASPVGPVDPEATVPIAPTIPTVDDPMLQPIEPSTRTVGDWRQAVTLVRERSTSIGAAHARIAEASARARQALADSLPTVEGTAELTQALLFGTGTGISNEGVNDNIRLPQRGTIVSGLASARAPVVSVRSWYDYRTSRDAIRGAKVSAQEIERLALLELADTIVTVVTAERLAEVTRVSLRSNLSNLDLMRRRTQLGAAEALDVLRAEQEVMENRRDVVQADEAVRQAREAFGLALGYPEEWGVTTDIRIDALAAEMKSWCSPVEDPSERSDVLAARLELDIAAQRVKAVDYGRIPTLDVFSEFTATNRVYTPNARPVQWSIGAALSIPIYDAGRITAERKLYEAEQAAATHRLTEVSRAAQLEVRRSLRAIKVAEANLQVSRQVRDVSLEAVKVARTAFVQGTGTSFDVVDTSRISREAELDLIIKEFEIVRARVTALLALSNCDL